MNIILCGFMGSGKTTVANILSRLINKKVTDIDKYIEKNENRTISEIFLSDGEVYFRTLETKAVSEISQMDNLIIATGGGIILNSQNTEMLKQNGKIVFIDVTVETILNHLRLDTIRPLLQSEDKEKAVTELLNSRLPFYKASADIIIDGNGKVTDIAKKIIFELEIL